MKVSEINITFSVCFMLTIALGTIQLGLALASWNAASESFFNVFGAN